MEDQRQLHTRTVVYITASLIYICIQQARNFILVFFIFLIWLLVDKYTIYIYIYMLYTRYIFNVVIYLFLCCLDKQEIRSTTNIILYNDL